MAPILRDGKEMAGRYKNVIAWDNAYESVEGRKGRLGKAPRL